MAQAQRAEHKKQHLPQWTTQHRHTPPKDVGARVDQFYLGFGIAGAGRMGISGPTPRYFGVRTPLGDYLLRGPPNRCTDLLLTDDLRHSARPE